MVHVIAFLFFFLYMHVEVSLQDEPARGVCALLEVLLECYNDGCKVKVWLQKQKYPMKILQSIKIYLDGREICKMVLVNTILC